MKYRIFFRIEQIIESAAGRGRCASDRRVVQCRGWFTDRDLTGTSEAHELVLESA